MLHLHIDSNLEFRRKGTFRRYLEGYRSPALLEKAFPAKERKRGRCIMNEDQSAKKKKRSEFCSNRSRRKSKDGSRSQATNYTISGALVPAHQAWNSGRVTLPSLFWSMMMMAASTSVGLIIAPRDCQLPFFEFRSRGTRTKGRKQAKGTTGQTTAG